MVVGLKLDNGEMFAGHLVEETIPLQPGDLYLLFTDGISEAMNARDDLFGESRLGRLVETHAHCRRRNCASASCATSPRLSATRRSTTT
jgi:hypothetical protein